MDYGTLQPAQNRIDSLIDSVLDFLAKSDRGFCQEVDRENCFLLAEISDRHTSDALCRKHYYERQGRRNFEVIRGAERGI